MQLSSQSHYGLYAMIGLARVCDVRPVVSLASDADIPADYLEKILQKLKKAGLVNSKKGIGGGYFLASEPCDITTGQIVRALEQCRAMPRACAGPGSCSKAPSCTAHAVWSRVQGAIDDTLDSIPLSDLV